MIFKLINRLLGRFYGYRKCVGGCWVKYPRRFREGHYWYRVCRKCHHGMEGIVNTAGMQSLDYPLDLNDIPTNGSIE